MRLGRFRPPDSKSDGSRAMEYSSDLVWLASDLAKYDVVTARGREHQCRTPLRLGQVGEWKMQDYDVPCYKSAQASSSSGESQSFIKEDSARRAGAASSAFLDLRDWMKPSSASKS